MTKAPAVIIVVLSAILGVGIANAYSLPRVGSITPDIPASPSINLNWNDVFNNLTSPFQNFSRSLQSAADTPVSNFSFATSAVVEHISTGTRSLWDRFDAWLYGIFGFHIAAFFGIFWRFFALFFAFIKALIGLLWGIFFQK